MSQTCGVEEARYNLSQDMAPSIRRTKPAKNVHALRSQNRDGVTLGWVGGGGGSVTRRGTARASGLFCPWSRLPLGESALQFLLMTYLCHMRVMILYVSVLVHKHLR